MPTVPVTVTPSSVNPLLIVAPEMVIPVWSAVT